MTDLYRAVWRVTGRQQLVLIVLSLLVAAAAVVPLKFQELAINSLVRGGDLHRLAWLCGGFAGAILVSAALKFVLGLRLSIVGERVVLLIRERLYRDHVAAAAHDAAGGPTRGRLVAMLAAEAETVGAFAGSAIAEPLLQLGTLVSVTAFIFASQPRLGALAVAVIVPQAAIVAALQNRVNRRVRERVQSVRDVSDRISVSDMRRVEDEVLREFHRIFETRRRIFRLKLSAKLALGAISAVGKVGVLFLGGWLVLDGRSDVGIVVASLSGLQRIEGPWRDLVTFFRTASTVRIQYEMLVRAIAPPGRALQGTPASR
jgi:ABC-type bacteriocin/lantibiotic exporter with double-glycine peptidase domain